MAEVIQTFEDGANPAKVVKMDYQSNSKRSKNAEKSEEKQRPEKKVEKVVEGEVVTRKKPLGRKIAETFTKVDLANTGQYVLFDVVIPAVKDMIADAGTTALQRALFGDNYRASSTRRSSSRPSGQGGYVAYNRITSPAGRAGEADEPRDISRHARANHNFDEIILRTRAEADEVLDRLTDLIRDYDVATVSDLYDLVGVTGSFTDDKWGWNTMNGAGVQHIREGYLLVMPKPIALT